MRIDIYRQLDEEAEWKEKTNFFDNFGLRKEEDAEMINQDYYGSTFHMDERIRKLLLYAQELNKQLEKSRYESMEPSEPENWD